MEIRAVGLRLDMDVISLREMVEPE